MIRSIDIIRESENFLRINFKHRSLGNLILITIFSYSCMNCLRSMKFIKLIYNHYKKYGLELVLIHPYEFEFEKKPENVINALKKNKINFPTIIDNKRRLISALGINFWPTDILLKNNKVAYSNIGEGNYKKLDSAIRQQISNRGNKNIKPAFSKEPKLSKIPTVYCSTIKKGIIRKYSNNKKVKIRFGIVYVNGQWKREKEFIKPISKGNHQIFILTKGIYAYMVACPIGKTPCKVSVKINDTIAKKIDINKEDVHCLGKFKNKSPKIVEITPNSNKLKIYSFSFE